MFNRGHDPSRGLREFWLGQHGIRSVRREHGAVDRSTPDGMFKKIGVQLELITDPAMYLWIESGLRGGRCRRSKRSAKAKKALVGNLNLKETKKCIAAWDANNLYPRAMSYYLQSSHFFWVAPEILEQID